MIRPRRRIARRIPAPANDNSRCDYPLAEEARAALNGEG